MSEYGYTQVILPGSNGVPGPTWKIHHNRQSSTAERGYGVSILVKDDGKFAVARMERDGETWDYYVFLEDLTDVTQAEIAASVEWADMLRDYPSEKENRWMNY